MARQDLNLTSLLPRWFKDEKIRQKLAALEADHFAAMAFPRTGREFLLNLSKFMGWVSRKV